MTKAWQEAPGMRLPQGGFTIIELVVTIVVLAVLTGIGIPSLREFLVRSQLSSAAGEIHAAVARTRQESITRGTFVTITPLTGTDWATGYQIFVNPRNRATYTPTDSVGAGTSIVSAEILTVRDAPNWSYITWPANTSDGNPHRDYFTFDDTGRPRNFDGTVMTPASPSRVRMCISGGACRELLVDNLGRIQILKN
ncbi:MAG: prepilin-type N-terminal cleavage/methylation domain-containing protein [Burkholderiales bacterium]|nr:MAG: prepilin-type N-terminal cleavage/methylation domain-containing protein [Burkholderiales bacterium]